MFEAPTADPAFIDPSYDCRAVTFENPTGARGRGGQAANGRKGAPSRRIRAGDRVVLADLEGPGVIRHFWLTMLPAPPEHLRAVMLEVFYDGAREPSISVPVVDFFGLPHGRPVPMQSAVMSVLEGRGYNSYAPMPFRRGVRVEVVNQAPRGTILYYQIDCSLHAELPVELGYLHASFRRENPTTLRRDFVIADGLEGPGRFFGCNVGVRVIDAGDWYGEGEMKAYLDGDDRFPTICGTGLEDYVGSAWGMGRFDSLYSGAPLRVKEGEEPGGPTIEGNPDLLGFYRWHLLDPIMFERELKVTIQQIGSAFFAQGQEAALEAYEKTNPAAGEGWIRDTIPGVHAWGIAERVDDYCATAYVYCARPQPVPRVDVGVAVADIERRPYETANTFELVGQSMA
ncbi:MAG: glycoside hydrolase family 172 protein [Acidimicrobiales bacterium]